MAPSTSPIRDSKAAEATETREANGEDDSSAPFGWMKMKGLGSKARVRDRKEDNNGSADMGAFREVRSNDGLLGRDADEGGLAVSARMGGQGEDVTYKVYKIRWFGLVQLALLNIIVSWDVSILSPRCLYRPLHLLFLPTNYTIAVQKLTSSPFRK